MIDDPLPARNANPSNSPTWVAEPARRPPPPITEEEEEESRRRTTPKIVASRSRVSGPTFRAGQSLRAAAAVVAGGGDERTLLMVWRKTKAYSIRQAQP